MRALITALLLVAASATWAELLPNDYEKMNYPQALERVKAQPERHVMIYFGLETFCPPCIYTRGLLTGSTFKALYKPNYIVVPIDLRMASKENMAAIEKYNVRWAPTLIFLDHGGNMVLRKSSGFKNEKYGILVHEFVSQKLYRKTDYGKYFAANFNASGAQRIVPETKVVKPAPADDRPRLRDVLAQKHEQVAGEPLKKLLAEKRMEKENQD